MSPYLSALDDLRLGFCDFIRASPVQRVLSRGVYEEQYERSLYDCMAGAAGFEEMLDAHRALVSSIAKEGAHFGNDYFRWKTPSDLPAWTQHG